MIKKLSFKKKYSDRVTHALRNVLNRKTPVLLCTDFAEVIWGVEGTCTHVINNQKYLMEKGRLFLLRPGDRHQLLIKAKTTCHLDVVLFPGEILTSFSRQYMPENLDFWGGDFGRSFLLSDDSRLRLSNYAKELSANLNNRMLLDRFLLNLFYELGLYELEERKNLPDWLSRALIELKKIENSRQGARILEKLCNRSLEHVSRTLKEYLGITSLELINRARMEYAAIELVTSNKQILDIAYDCGFSSLGQFYNLFQQQYGATPAKYRKENVDSRFIDE